MRDGFNEKINIENKRGGERERVEHKTRLKNNTLCVSVHTMCLTVLFKKVLGGVTEVPCTSMLIRAIDTNYETLTT